MSETADEYYPSGTESDVHDAGDMDANAGACPPIIIRYRIFQEIDFNQVFGQQPATVIVR